MSLFLPPGSTPALWLIVSFHTVCAGSSASAVQPSGCGLLPVVWGNVVPGHLQSCARLPGAGRVPAGPCPWDGGVSSAGRGRWGPSQSRDSPVWLCSGTSPLFWCRTQPAPHSPPSAPRCTRCGQSFLPAEGGHSPRARACADVSSFLLRCSLAPGGCCPAQQPCMEKSTISCLWALGVSWGALVCKLWTASPIPEDLCEHPSRETSKGEGQGSPQPGPGADLSSISGDIKATTGSTPAPHHVLLKPKAWQGARTAPIAPRGMLMKPCTCRDQGPLL